jgi:ubiquinone/menaquinone biosynthesis C-methylase UbiE
MFFRKIKNYIKKKFPHFYAILLRIYYMALIPFKRGRYLQNPSLHWDNFVDLMIEEHTQRLPEIYNQEADFLIQEISLIKPESILEIGCGYGRILKLISEKLEIKKLVGVDFSSKMLSKGKEYLNFCPEIDLILADATKKLPFSDNEFDLVFSSQVLMEISPHKVNRAIEEMLRVTKKYLIIIENNNRGPRSFSHNYKKIIQNQKCQIIKSITNPSDLRFRLGLEKITFLIIQK